MEYHVPVMLKECIDGLDIKKDGVYVDLTFGGGGHSKAILEKLGEKGKLFGFDQDPNAEENSLKDERFTFVASNFRFFLNFVRYFGFEKVDGILADLGVSWHQFDTAERGFAFRFDAELDMRMNTNASTKASDILNKYESQKIELIFRNYGEIKNARALTSEIVKSRQNNPIETTFDLVSIASRFCSERDRSKYLSQVFQALRIELNNEMLVLTEMLSSTEKALKKGGRLVVMSYHSLEDRLVKNYVKSGNFEGVANKDFYGNLITPFSQINNKVIVPSEQEIYENGRARSAKLRIAEKN